MFDAKANDTAGAKARFVETGRNAANQVVGYCTCCRNQREMRKDNALQHIKRLVCERRRQSNNECPVCFNRYTEKSYLTRHIRRDHRQSKSSGSKAVVEGDGIVIAEGAGAAEGPPPPVLTPLTSQVVQALPRTVLVDPGSSGSHPLPCQPPTSHRNRKRKRQRCNPADDVDADVVNADVGDVHDDVDYIKKGDMVRTI